MDGEARGAERRERALLTGAVFLCAVVAWLNKFIQDDAFITFRYAKHLAQGHGLVWNVGEPPVAGFTNTLWTLLMALVLKMGMEPVLLSQEIGVLCFAIGLSSLGSLAARLTGSWRAAWCVALGVGLNATFNSYATGGLETMSQVMLVVAVASCVERALGGSAPSRGRDAALASIAAGAALWTRLDSLILVGPLLVLLVTGARRRGESRVVTLAIGPAAALLAGLLAFNRVVLHSWVPVTFAAKTSGTDGHVLAVGVDYVAGFLAHYEFLPILAVAAWLARGRARPAFVDALIATVVLWTLYVIGVGGDFMEYRFMVPALPFAALACAWAVFDAARRWLLELVTAASVAASGYYWLEVRKLPALDFEGSLETIAGLDAHITHPDQSWVEVGKGLGKLFACDREATIAVTAAGAVPYYSDLRTIDMLGLSDPWIVQHGVTFGYRPGHRHMATLPYLLEKRANLVVQPWAKVDPELALVEYNRLFVVNRYLFLSRPEDLPADASMLELPIAPDRKMRVLYLVKDPKIDRCIATGGWRVLPIKP